MSVLTKRSTRILQANHQTLYDAFAFRIDAIWRAGGERRPLGLAISGGVDSMALATLCRQFRDKTGGRSGPSSRSSPAFTAFIVDHQLRRGSGDEAHKVALEMHNLDITPRVLRLDWTGYRDPPSLPNLESVARRLRYRALGRACRDAGIASLLVGHHADDQAETALMRMVAGYTGAGLAGMKSTVALPECRGVYGVDRSGQGIQQTGNFNIEGGGVGIHRPLLQFRKKQLVDICREHGVRWFEDHTNADVTLTQRNAVRSLLQNEDILPKALRHARLLQLTHARDAKEARGEDEAATLCASIPLTLHVRSGEAMFRLDEITRERLGQREDVARRIISRILHLVTPKPKVSLQDLDRALALIGGDEEKEGPSRPARSGSAKAQMAGVQMQRRDETPGDAGSRSFTVFRALPPATEVDALIVQLWPYQSSTYSDQPTVVDQPDVHDQWRLWDGRYWIRVQPPTSHIRSNMRVFARLLNTDGLAQLRRTSKTQGADEWTARALDRLQRLATHDVRLTLPAIFAVSSDDAAGAGDGEAKKELVAVPAIDWYGPGWMAGSTHHNRQDECWRFEIRYKHVDLRHEQVDTSKHGWKAR